MYEKILDNLAKETPRLRRGMNYQILRRTHRALLDGTGPVRDRAITSGNNYRLARPRGSPSRLFLCSEIPTTKNALRGKLLSRERRKTAREKEERRGSSRKSSIHFETRNYRNKAINSLPCNLFSVLCLYWKEEMYFVLLIV